MRCFFVAIAAALVVCATASATTPRPRVLAVKFENDVNPVTQSYVNDQIARAKKIRKVRDGRVLNLARLSVQHEQA